MSANDVLRRMLDERGVEYEGETDEDGWAFTRWHGFDDTGWLAASDELCGLLDLRGRYLFTPAQAIAATLGTGTCRMDFVAIDAAVGYPNLFLCSECKQFAWVKAPNTLCYCPNCGRKVVEPTTNDVDAEVDDG